MKILSDAASRFLYMLISKYKMFKDIGFSTHNKIYSSTVIPARDYSSEVCGNRKYPKDETVQKQAARVFLEVRRFAPVVGL